MEAAFRCTAKGDREQLAVDLSHVSKRFRGLAEKVPELWTELRTKRRPDFFSQSFARTRDLELSLDCHTLRGFLTAVPTVMASIARLSWLRVSSSIDADHEATQALIHDGTQNLELPALKTLSIYYRDLNSCTLSSKMPIIWCSSIFSGRCRSFVALLYRTSFPLLCGSRDPARRLSPTDFRKDLLYWLIIMMLVSVFIFIGGPSLYRALTHSFTPAFTLYTPYRTLFAVRLPTHLTLPSGQSMLFELL